MLTQTDQLAILITIPSESRALGRLQHVCPQSEIRVADVDGEGGEALDPELLRDIDVLLCSLPPKNFDDFNRLKWIQLTSAGYNQVLDLPVLKRGIRVTNGLGNFDGPIAEWNIMMMLMWQREMLEQLDNQNNRIWDSNARYQRDLYGSTIGFWGYGGIARETARLAKAMNLNVWALTRGGRVRDRVNTYCVQETGDPEGKLPDRVFAPDQLEEFLGGVDYLFITVPLTAATCGMIGEKQLRMLRPSAVVINPARAPIIDEQAFVRCLEERWIRGASLDVHYAYPLPPEHRLWSIPNLIMTPHISGSVSSPHFLERIYDIFTQNLERFICDRPLLNALTESQLRGE